jgi:hypothetical protein
MASGYLELLGYGAGVNRIDFGDNQFSQIEYVSEITPNYTETMVYGRNEPIVTYKNTSRNLKISFVISQGSGDNVSWNSTMNKMIHLLYPKYDDKYVIVKTPVYRFKFFNLLQDPIDDEQGQVCILKNVNIGPSGFKYGKVATIGDYTATETGRVEGTNNGAKISFKEFKVAMTVVPLQTIPIGFSNNDSFGNVTFPFGTITVKANNQ